MTEHEKKVLYVAKYFNQSIVLDDGNDNPIVREFSNFIKLNIEEKELNKFISMVISNCEFFPRMIKVSEIYNSFRTHDKTYKEIKQDFGNAIEDFSKKTKIEKTTTEALDKILMLKDFFDFKDDNKFMTKYGSLGSGYFWAWMGSMMDDAEYEQNRGLPHSQKLKELFRKKYQESKKDFESQIEINKLNFFKTA